MKTSYFIANDRPLSVKETAKNVYTRVLDKHGNPIEVKHDKAFLAELTSKFSLTPCNYCQFLTVSRG